MSKTITLKELIEKLELLCDEDDLISSFNVKIIKSNCILTVTGLYTRRVSQGTAVSQPERLPSEMISRFQ